MRRRLSLGFGFSRGLFSLGRFGFAGGLGFGFLAALRFGRLGFAGGFGFGGLAALRLGRRRGLARCSRAAFLCGLRRDWLAHPERQFLGARAARHPAVERLVDLFRVAAVRQEGAPRIMVVNAVDVNRIGLRQFLIAADDDQVLVVLLRSGGGKIVRSGDHGTIVGERIDHNRLRMHDGVHGRPYRADAELGALPRWGVLGADAIWKQNVVVEILRRDARFDDLAGGAADIALGGWLYTRYYAANVNVVLRRSIEQRVQERRLTGHEHQEQRALLGAGDQVENRLEFGLAVGR